MHEAHVPPGLQCSRPCTPARLRSSRAARAPRPAAPAPAAPPGVMPPRPPPVARPNGGGAPSEGGGIHDPE
eukprot:3818963-Prymnesium_polylepis.1